MSVKCIVLTGGPCAGKTKLLKSATEYLKKQNVDFITIKETATELLSYGFSRKDSYKFQEAVFDFQMLKEDFCRKNTANINPDKTTYIILDRGPLDGKCYITESQWEMLLDSRGFKEADLSKRYDSVIYLESCVASDKCFYETESNEFRSESNSEALLLETKNKDFYANSNIPLHFIPATESFEEKEQCFIAVLNEIINK